MNYYLIPLSRSQDYFVGEKSLMEGLHQGFPKIYEAEVKRINLLRSSLCVNAMSTHSKKQISKLEDYTNNLYAEAKLPKFIIARGCDHGAREILSGIVITPDFPAVLGIRKVKEEEAMNYFKKVDYSNKIINFLPYINGAYENLLRNVEEEINQKNIIGKVASRIRIAVNKKHIS